MGARVRTYVCEGWVGAYPHPTPYPPTPLYPLYCKGVIYPPTPLVGKVRTTCNTIPQTMVRYACVTTARAVNQAPASHRCPRMPQLPGQAPASPGKPRQAPASPVKPQESEARSARCLIRLEKTPMSGRLQRSRDRVLEPSKVYFETVQSPPGVPEAFRNASNTFEGRRGV